MVDLASGYKLLHHGSIALAKVEAAGIRIDEAYLKRAIERTDDLIIEIETELKNTDVGKAWQAMRRRDFNFGSRTQLGEVVAEVLEVELPLTEAGRPKTDGESLVSVDHPFLSRWLELEAWKKARSTYLEGLRREVVDGYLHPFFNLHTASTYRSSSDSPNFQNFPIRRERISKVIRRCFIPRRGHVLMESDYGGIEVRVAACYNRDPRLIEYICNPEKDMHRDMAAQCFVVPDDEVSKELRYAGKNQFVFPQFYGASPWNCAKDLWESRKTKSTTDHPASDYLKEVGIRKLGGESCPAGSFAAHIRTVCDEFWGDRFKVYGEWRERWVENYKRRGFLELLTGFRCGGLTKKNEIINYAIQGSAFHCLLKALIRIVLASIPRYRFKAMVVGQIHDSLLSDVPLAERSEYEEMTTEVMTKWVPSTWAWIIVPLVVETAVYSKSWARADKEN